MCGCDCCISENIIHSCLLSWRINYLGGGTKDTMHKAEVLVKWLILYFRHIRTMWCCMGVIFIKHHMTQLWQKRVHVYRPKMRCHTVNVWCIVVNNVLVFISQFSNCIRITQTHVLQFAFMFLTSYHAVQFMSYKHHKFFCPFCFSIPSPTPNM